MQQVGLARLARRAEKRLGEPVEGACVVRPQGDFKARLAGGLVGGLVPGADTLGSVVAGDLLAPTANRKQAGDIPMSAQMALVLCEDAVVLISMNPVGGQLGDELLRVGYALISRVVDETKMRTMWVTLELADGSRGMFEAPRGVNSPGELVAHLKMWGLPCATAVASGSHPNFNHLGAGCGHGAMAHAARARRSHEQGRYAVSLTRFRDILGARS